MIPNTKGGIIFEQMRKQFGLKQVIDANDFDIWIPETHAEKRTSDTAKTIDSNFYHSK